MKEVSFDSHNNFQFDIVLQVYGHSGIYCRKRINDTFVERINFLYSHLTEGGHEYALTVAPLAGLL